MNNLAKYSQPSSKNLEDVQKIKACTLALERYSLLEVEMFWIAYSEDCAASWIFVSPDSIKDFNAWLES